MKNLILSILIITSISLYNCEKDEGKLPEIVFKTGENYTSGNANVEAGASVIIGIKADKAEEKDPLIAFNISKSVNGGSATTLINEDLSGDSQDEYEYDYTYQVTETSGDQVELTFTVTNRDGLQGQKMLRLSIN